VIRFHGKHDHAARLDLLGDARVVKMLGEA